MKCPRCQHENRPGAKFCEECAAPLARACANCGAQLSATAKFCSECAHPAGPPAPPSSQRFGAPETYTPKHLAEQIINSKAALEGERKQVTVLFADLKGSMELLADRDPEEGRKILDPVIEHMMEAVHRYEGTVNQVMGDGIMALFGAPLAHEDHAVRACYAALRMQESVKTYADEVRRSHAAVVKIRVGVNSGEVVVRAIGNDLHMDYTAVGQATHLAARMEQIADPGAIVITPETLALAEGYVEVKSLGPVPVKGLAEAVEVYEVTGAGPARTRLQATARRGLTRFVGRDAELEQLRRAQQLAASGHGQVAAIVGEAGVGKSRLTYEFTHSHRVQDWLILESSSVSYGKATSYLPVIDLLKGYFKIGDRDNHREMRDKVMGRVLGLDRALEPLLPPLLALLDVPVEDPAWQNLDPPQRRQRTLDAVKRLLLRESQVQPLLVVFEDLHWIDGETQTLLDSLVESLGSARLLLLTNYRPEYEHRWGSKTAYSQLRLDSLPTERAAELLAALLGPDPGLAPLTQMLVKRGNPFFLEETVRTLVETGALAGERGAYRLTRPVEALQVPATVQTILAARIDRLPQEEKRLLQAASVIGKDVPYALVAAIAEQPEETLRRGLAHLQETEFVYETQLFPELEYTFRHALTLEVAYGSLLHERRRALHARVVDALERPSAVRGSERAELLAHHAVRGERWDKAARYLYLAGERAVASARYSAAVSFYDATVQAIGRDTTPDLSLKLDVYLELWVARLESGDVADLPALADKAEALAHLLHDNARLAQVRLRQAQAYRSWGDGTLNAAIDLVGEAIALADSADIRTRSYARNLRALYYRDVGRLGEAINEFDAAAAMLSHSGPDHETSGLVMPIYVTSRTLQAEAYAALGEFEQALAMARDAHRMAETIGHLPSVALAYAHLGYVSVQRGDVEAGVSLLERGWALGEENGFIHATLANGFYLAHALAVGLDRADDGLRCLGRALDASPPGYPMFVLWSKYRGLIASVYLAAGRLTEARTEIDRALALVERRNALGHRPLLLRLQAELVSRSTKGTTVETVSSWEDAMRAATELGMRPLVAHCHLGLGKLYRRTDKREQAQEHLATAMTMYREMGMTYWLEKAEAEMRSLA
jgi:class 3 adenylate cyclase/tetratricopeptide (TPR) repeat protein